MDSPTNRRPPKCSSISDSWSDGMLLSETHLSKDLLIPSISSFQTLFDRKSVLLTCISLKVDNTTSYTVFARNFSVDHRHHQESQGPPLKHLHPSLSKQFPRNLRYSQQWWVYHPRGNHNQKIKVLITPSSRRHRKTHEGDEQHFYQV